MLKFQKGNAKLGTNVVTFSLPAGWSCPFATECLAKVAVDENGKRSVVDGKEMKFRCFAASQEAQYTNTYKARQYNFDMLRKLKTVDEIADLIENSLPKIGKRAKPYKGYKQIVRVHVSGDFYNQKYFDAWNEVAKRNPDRLFYAYTKSVKYWVARLGDIADNFSLTASEGGRNDAMIIAFDLKCASVVYSEQAAADKGLEIDHDDKLAMFGKESFALLLHGTQPKDSDASEALKELKRQGKGGYSRK